MNINTTQNTDEVKVVFLNTTEELVALKEQELEYKKKLEAIKAREKELIDDVMSEGPVYLKDGRKLILKSRSTPKINQNVFKSIYKEQYLQLAKDGELDVKIDHVKAVLPADEIDGVVTYTRSDWVELETIK